MNDIKAMVDDNVKVQKTHLGREAKQSGRYVLTFQKNWPY